MQLMQLSEAISLGAMSKPQAFTSGIVHMRLRDQEAFCALEAASFAVGHEFLDYGVQLALWPVLLIQESCPSCCAVYDSLISVVWHLNDHHRWSRERIATWVAQFETRDSPEAAPARSGRDAVGRG